MFLPPLLDMPGPSRSRFPSSFSSSTFSSARPPFVRASSLASQESSRLPPRSLSTALLRDRLEETLRGRSRRGSSPRAAREKQSSPSLLNASQSSLLSFSSSRRLAPPSPSSSSTSSPDGRLSSPRRPSSSTREPSPSLPSSRRRNSPARRQPPLFWPDAPSPQSRRSASLRQAAYEQKLRRFQAKLRAADLLLSPPLSPATSSAPPSPSPPQVSCSPRSPVSDRKREEAPSVVSTSTPASSYASRNASLPPLSSRVSSLRELYLRANRSARESESRPTRQSPDLREGRASSRCSPRQSSLSSSFSVRSGPRNGKACTMTGSASDEALEVRVKNVEEKAAQIRFAFNTRSKLQQQEVNSLNDRLAALRLRRDLPVSGFLGSAGMAERLIKDELQANKHARLAFAEQCVSDGDCMLQGVRDLHRKTFEKTRARRGAESGVVEIEESMQGCREVLQALGDSRKSLESSLQRLLSEAFQGVQETISQERRICDDAEASMSRMLEELREQARGDIRASRENREQVEEQILQLLEDACVKVETSVLTNANLPQQA
ncbi:hypothetical protein TGPRC2_236790 [Toxoplasma gondii TgCatPRC2]|uniref:Uncharacterized protein n=2 Tax=Toxoplasma gondii TaxID=5811 RepID=A0A151HEN0_TOXGO|nr:hypothetical protein TGPRC2_236790 [Toxoplasma gondii TgCatPRC2]PIL99394.1 hypothetical protein TGCOUG_236790 [Toxoplasma gondii COUG]